jgi:hypothetical protein
VLLLSPKDRHDDVLASIAKSLPRPEARSVSVVGLTIHNEHSIMAGRRPRLVHVGSPIIDDDGDPSCADGDPGFHHHSDVAASSSRICNDADDDDIGDSRGMQGGDAKIGVRTNFSSSLLSRAGGGGGGTGATASDGRYKLRTKFVVGGGGIDPPPTSDRPRHPSASTTTALPPSRPDHDHHRGMMERSSDDAKKTKDVGEIFPRERADHVASFPNPYKLRTTLVVGNDDDSDDMMMDEGECDHRHVHVHPHERQYDITDGSYHPTLHDHESHHGRTIRAFDDRIHDERQADVASSIHPAHAIHRMPLPSISPLVVLDGANIAYAYSDASHPAIGGGHKRQPDPRGIRIVVEYFIRHRCRVQAVVPVSWYRLKPRPADDYHLDSRSRGGIDSDARMVTEEVEVLRELRSGGYLVAVPPGDDDDAYAIALARWEDDRHSPHRDRLCDDRQTMSNVMMEEDETTTCHLPLGGYVVSNDMFHDAIRRDEDGQRTNHQLLPLNRRPSSLKGWLSRKRISYSFANIGTTSHFDDRIRLDFVPNPRCDLIEAIDAWNRMKIGMR